jgi:hypothetical protein
MAKTFADAKAALCKTALLIPPQQGWELALMGGCSFAAEILSLLSVAAFGIFFQDVGASTNSVFSF